MPNQNNATPNGQIIALTGATGFLGDHVLGALVNAGYHVKALTRRPQPSRDGVTWISGALDNTDSLRDLTQNASILINLAGLTKAISRDAFFDVNVAGSLRLFDAAHSSGVSHVIHISSLAAREPQLSHYGASKAGTEMLLTARKWNFTWTIIRPPAIYGPGDKEILKLLKASKIGILPAPGSSKNRVSMIHAADLADAITILCDQSNKSSILEIDDGKKRGYAITEIAAYVPTPRSSIRCIPVPFFVLGALGFINQIIAYVTKKPAMLTVSTARYLCHPDWTIKETRRFRHNEWSPQFDLKAGLENTIEWYRKNGLL